MDTSTETTNELTPVQYARARHQTIGYVYAQIWDGRLRARKVLGRWLIPATELTDKETRYSRLRDKESQ
jgi:hypothetical protein